MKRYVHERKNAGEGAGSPGYRIVAVNGGEHPDVFMVLYACS